jgi:hypothetical protein
MSSAKQQQKQAPKGLEPRNKKDGSVNPKYVDVLEEDKPIAGQKFVCISFISPENILKEKNLYYFNKFLNKWDMNKSLEKYNQFLSFIAYKYNMNFDDLTKDLGDFCKEEKSRLFATTVEDEYKNFLDANEEKLEKEFNEDHQFQTSVRGLKVRGSFPSQKEAELRCKMLREVDPNHDVYVGQVGIWMPFHPEAYKTGRVEYLEEELNQLMNEKVKNERQAKTEFDKRVRETKEKAMEENRKKAEESGNVLTQMMDKDGNLLSVKDTNTFESDLGDNVSVADIRRELFNNENVVIDYKNSTHGLEQLTSTATPSTLATSVTTTSEAGQVTSEAVSSEAASSSASTQDISTRNLSEQKLSTTGYLD